MYFFGKKSTKQLLEQAEQQPLPDSWNKEFWQRFRKNRLAKWSLRILYSLIFIAVFADFIANERPLYCQFQGDTYFPVFHSYLEDLKLTKPSAAFLNQDWADIEYESAIFPPIPYSADKTDLYASRLSPFGEQKVKSLRWRHWLGTGLTGKDMAAGLIIGVRYALLVGLISMSIAVFLGVLLGSLAGYFGDDKLKISRIRVLLNFVGFFFGIFFAFSARAYQLRIAGKDGGLFFELTKSVFIFLFILLIFNLLASLLKRISILGKKVKFPIDLLIMRAIEVLTSIPGLLLLLSLVAIIQDKSILYVMLIIGFLGWTGIARFTRAEMLRIRNLEYMEAGRALGYGNARMMLRHALPNAITPILITVAFGIAGAILLEASLSFLNLGAASDEITWGSMLTDARSQDSIKAWWLAVFPGFMIFLTVTVFNLIGEGVTEALRE